jgi:hypothetical protein
MSDFPTGKMHVSFSEVKTWRECGWRHKLIHIDKVPGDPPSVHTDFGKIVHAQCENYLKSRQIDVDLAAAQIREAWKANSHLNSAGEPDDPEVWVSHSQNILADLPAFMETEFPGWQYMGAEMELYEPISSTVMHFKGFIDGVITCKGKKGEDLIWIIDWKTAGPGGWHPEKKRDPLVQMQLALYKSFLAEKLGVDKKNIRCAFLLLKRGAKLGKTCEAFRVSVGPVTEERARKTVLDMVRTVSKRMFLKNRLSCKFCPFHDTDRCTAV